jgi:hypothetical protein
MENHEHPPDAGRPEPLQQVMTRHLGSRPAGSFAEADREKLLAAGQRAEALRAAGGGDEGEKGKRGGQSSGRKKLFGQPKHGADFFHAHNAPCIAVP